MTYDTIYLSLAIIFAFIMAWGIGANDVANALGTSVGSKAISFKQGIIIAALFEGLGALLAGGEVTQTIGQDLLSQTASSLAPDKFIWGMLASLLAAATWLMLATRLGWPVSTTHSIIGAILGFGSIVLGPSSVNWSPVLHIFLSWIITPFIAGLIAYVILRSIQNYILNSEHPLIRAITLLPLYIGLVSFIIAAITLLKGLIYLKVVVSFQQGLFYAACFATFCTLTSYLFLLRRAGKSLMNRKASYHSQLKQTERLFAVLMVFTASSMAFAHGANDVSNAIGPLVAIFFILKNPQHLAITYVPFWALALGALGIIGGLSVFGLRVIITIGRKITFLSPSRGFAAELATATTVVLATGTGLPISTSQTLVGAILGIGFARGVGALNLKTIQQIFLSWIITLPTGALLAVLFYAVLHAIFR